MKKEVIQILDLEYNYPGESKIIIKHFSGCVYEKEILGIVGKNGAGKSTLLRLIASLSQPMNGKIIINGFDSQDLKRRRDYLLNVIYLSHDKVLLNDYTIKEYFKIYSTLYPDYSKDIETELMNKFLFSYEDRVSILSTGNRMKFFMIFALATQVKIILIDEITAVLDPENRIEFYELLKKYQDNRSFVIATNIVEELGELAGRIWFVNESQVVIQEASNVKNLFTKKAV